MECVSVAWAASKKELGDGEGGGWSQERVLIQKSRGDRQGHCGYEDICSFIATFLPSLAVNPCLLVKELLASTGLYIGVQGMDVRYIPELGEQATDWALFVSCCLWGRNTIAFFLQELMGKKKSLSQLISSDALIRPLGLFEKSPKNLPYKWTGVRDLPTPVIISLL